MTDPGTVAPLDGPDATLNLTRPESGPADEVLLTVGLSSDDVATISALPAGSALLVMRPGPLAGERFLLDHDRVTTGRSTHADIFLDDVTVSRKHAELSREDGTWTIRDIGSLNGTYVNRNRIEMAALTSGDEVQIGKFRMTFHASPAGVSAPEEPTSGQQ